MLWDEVISDEPQPKSRWSLVSQLSALISFTTVALVGAHWAPWPEDFVVSVGVEHLRRQGDQYDAFYIGSSNVLRSFVPNVIDQRLAELGMPMRTFNVGGPGILGYEADYVLRHVLELENTHPKYLFIEPEVWDPRPKGEGMGVNMLSTRGVYWHDWRQTLAVLRGIPQIEESLYYRLDLALKHLHAFCWNISSYGEGLRILDNIRNIHSDQSVSLRQVADGRGFQSLEQLPVEETSTRRRTLTDFLEAYATKVEDIRRDNHLPLPAGADSRIAIPAQIEFVKSKGAEPIYVLPPTGLERSNALRLGEEGIIRLISYNDPDKYPLFYESRNRFDPAHLNRRAAVEFSKLFAEELVQLLQSESDQ